MALNAIGLAFWSGVGSNNSNNIVMKTYTSINFSQQASKELYMKLIAAARISYRDRKKNVYVEKGPVDMKMAFP